MTSFRGSGQYKNRTVGRVVLFALSGEQYGRPEKFEGGLCVWALWWTALGSVCSHINYALSNAAGYVNWVDLKVAGNNTDHCASAWEIVLEDGSYC